jgi:hypothetical protein
MILADTCKNVCQLPDTKWKDSASKAAIGPAPFTSLP